MTESHLTLGDVVDAYQAEVLGYLRRLTGDASDAKDLFQETFLRTFPALSVCGRERIIEPGCIGLRQTSFSSIAVASDEGTKARSLARFLPAVCRRQVGSGTGHRRRMLSSDCCPSSEAARSLRAAECTWVERRTDCGRYGGKPSGCPCECLPGCSPIAPRARCGGPGVPVGQ